MYDEPSNPTLPEKPKRHPAQHAPCPICGEVAYVWGYTSRHGTGWLGFKSDDAGMLAIGREVRARECQHCGNIQLFSIESPF